MEYTIQRADIQDAEGILRLQKTAYKIEADRYNNDRIPPLIQTIDELRVQFTDHVILKAVADNQIIGTVRACERGNTCYIGRLAVHPDMQNKGIGTALMKAIEDQFNSPRFELFTGSRSEKDIYLYRKLGYHIFRTEMDAFQKIELVYMEKKNTDR
jgi:GNAT superfamily N-acetyltransferase